MTHGCWRRARLPGLDAPVQADHRPPAQGSAPGVTGRTADRPELAAVTMVFDEPTHLPFWTRHYVRELGAANCTVIDHGSDPVLMARWRAGVGAGVNVIRLPRSPQDDTRRAAFVSALCSALLGYYPAVMYTDSDEIVVADPDRHAGLADYAAALAADPSAPAVITAHGYEVIHRASDEATLDWSRPAGRQRHWLRFSSALCKPVLIRRPVAWAPGFHCIEAPPVFGDLHLFHLRFADEADGLARLARTRAQPWAEAGAGSHQRMADADWLAMLRGMAGLPGDPARRLDAEDAELRRWTAAITDSDRAWSGGTYRYALDLAPMALWRLPERFRDRF